MILFKSHQAHLVALFALMLFGGCRSGLPAHFTQLYNRESLPAPNSRAFQSLAERLNIHAPPALNRVRLIRGGRETFDQMLFMIAGARSSVDLEMYIYYDDSAGRLISNALIRKARERVPVRLLIDDWGDLYFSDELADHLITGNVQLKYFNSFSLLMPWQFNVRTHRRMLIVDERQALTGGWGVAAWWRGTGDHEHVTDLQVHLEGPAAWEMHDHFQRNWQRQGLVADDAHQSNLKPDELYALRNNIDETDSAHRNSSIENRDAREEISLNDADNVSFVRHEFPATTALVAPIFNSPNDGFQSIYKMYILSSNAARRRIWITTPFFVPPDDLIQSWKRAVLRGVDVRLLLPHPRYVQEFPVIYAGNKHIQELLYAGVRVYIYNPRLIHTKSALFDDELTIIGTSNVDRRSFEINFESDVAIYDARIADRMQSIFLEDQAQSTELKAEYFSQRTLPTHLKECLWLPLESEL
ncbi:MAG: hypothetical protein KDK30_18185 [Leptospiraceae bacterium]|nr:hypothetical protein [Leptospiraceae bacterium]